MIKRSNDPLYRKLKRMERQGKAYRPKVSKIEELKKETGVPFDLLRKIRLKIKVYPKEQQQTLIFLELARYMWPKEVQGGIAMAYPDGVRNNKPNCVVVKNIRSKEGRKSLLYVLKTLRHTSRDSETVKWNMFLDVVWPWFDCLPQPKKDVAWYGDLLMCRNMWYDEIEEDLKNRTK